MKPGENLPKANPVSRPVDGALAYDQFANLDPNRHYVQVSPAADWHGRSWYEALGYEVEVARKDGPRPLAAGVTRKEGTEIQNLGQLLMSCPRDLYEARKRAGQGEVDEQVRGARKPLEQANLRNGYGMTVLDEGSAERLA